MPNEENRVQTKVYIPPKGQEWDNPTTLAEDGDINKYAKPWGDMGVLNEKEIENAIYPEVDEEGEYHHKDGRARHPETLYLTPGSPRHRSDSLSR